MINDRSMMTSLFRADQAEASILPFRPHRAIRNSMLQTVVSTFAPQHVRWVNRAAHPILLDAGPDQTGYDLTQPVRLLAYYNSAADFDISATSELGGEANPGEEKGAETVELPLEALPDDLPPVAEKGVVLMLHGWGGCSHSPYNMVVTDTLLRNNFDVVRLNLRDHGPDIHVDGHKLNKGIFYGTLLGEVAVAVERVAKMAGDRPFYIVGASMGGSFALRLAIRHNSTPFHNLRKVVAICPSVNPAAAARQLDETRIFLRYFRNLWVTSLYRKAELFPDLYDFAGLEKFTKLRDITEQWLSQFSHHASTDEYYAEYAVSREKIQQLNVPTTIVSARDDSVIPYADIEALGPHQSLDLRIQEYGGHVGFVDLFPFRHCLPRIVLELLNTSTDPEKFHTASPKARMGQNFSRELY